MWTSTTYDYVGAQGVPINVDRSCMLYDVSFVVYGLGNRPLIPHSLALQDQPLYQCNKLEQTVRQIIHVEE